MVCLGGLGICKKKPRFPTLKQTAAPSADAKDPKTVGSYGLGMNLGSGLKADGMDIDVDTFVQGLRDALQGAKPRSTEEQIHTAFKTLQADLQAKKAAKRKPSATRIRPKAKPT